MFLELPSNDYHRKKNSKDLSFNAAFLYSRVSHPLFCDDSLEKDYYGPGQNIYNRCTYIF